MFTSRASSYSSTCTFGFPPVFRQANQKSDVFAPKTLNSETVFSSPTGMPTYGGSSAWAFGQTSSTFRSSSSTSVEASGHSSSNNFECPSAIPRGNQKEDIFDFKTWNCANTFGSPIGMSNSHGTSTWEVRQTSSPLSTQMTFGALSSYESQGTRSPFSLKPSDCGGQERGSKRADYKRTAETTFSREKLVSISAMPVYKDKSHEELRWEDYMFTGKGGFGLNSSAVQSTSVANLSTTSWATTSISTTPVKPNPFGETFTSLATETTGWKFPGPTQTATWKFSGPTSASFPSQPLSFSSSANTSFTTITAAPSNPFNPVVPRTSNLSPISSLAPTSFTSQPFPFTSSANTFSTTVNAVPLNQFNQFVAGTTFFSSASSVSVAPLNHNPFTNSFTSLANQTSSSRFSSPTFAAFTSGLASTPSSLNDFWSTPIGGPFISTPTAVADSVSFSPVVSGLGSTFSQPETLFNPCVASTQNYNGAVTGIFGHSSVSQLSSSQITSMEKAWSAASPFGTLPPEPQMTFDGSQSTQSIQYGISSMPVKYKPTPVKYRLLPTRHLSRRNKLPLRKYDPKLNGPKIPYFSDNKEIPVAVFVARENPRAFVVCPERWPPKVSMEKMQEEKFSAHIYENERDEVVAYADPDDPTKEKETVPDAPARLEQPDYYTEPQISELEAKERAEPGFCSRVRDFVIGRRGYGCIKFLGETDVRKLHLETYVQFNNREVVVYMDESKKPPVGQGLNKPAEITLVNIKCIDKTSGKQYIDKYVNVLKKKTVAQGAEFVSYEPFGGEWKFRVQHF